MNVLKSDIGHIDYVLFASVSWLVCLANVNSRSSSLYAVARSSVACRLSVTFARPTQPVEIFRNVSMPLVPWLSIDIHGKFCGDCPRRTPPLGG